jgi:acetolactate synthase-1/2/3 large subunit
MQFKPNVKIVILNNQFLGMVRQWQELFHEKRYSFTDITSPDFVMLAQAYGIAGKKVTERSNLKDTLNEMLQSNESYLVEVMVGKQDNVFPMVPQGKGVAEIVLGVDEL